MYPAAPSLYATILGLMLGSGAGFLTAFLITFLLLWADSRRSSH